VECGLKETIIHLFKQSKHNANMVRVRVMMLCATFNIISVISWQSVLLVEETRLSGIQTHNVSGDRHCLHR
jgi:hypothetical protein